MPNPTLFWHAGGQAARALSNTELEEACRHVQGQTHRQQSWLTTQVKHRAAQTLVVPG